jgi:hypothetical protein
LAAALTLVVLAALFIIHQARVTLHPQLEDPRYWSGRGETIWSVWPGASAPAGPDYRLFSVNDMAYEEQELLMDMDMGQPSAVFRASPAPAGAAGAPRKAMLMAPGQEGQAQAGNQMVRLSQAPDAKAQNSAPRPAWNWRSVRLFYNETVSADQEVRLYIYGPAAWRFLGGLRLILMALFVLSILEVRFRPRLAGLCRPAAAASLILMAAGLWAGPAQAQAASGSWPDSALLKEYQARLLERKPLPPPGLPLLRLDLAAERLELELTVEAGREEIIPLPALDRDVSGPGA